MQIPVNQIVNVEPNNFQGLTKTTFLSSASNNLPVYMFHQPQNAPQVGVNLDGDIKTDQRGQLKFTKTPNPQYAGQQNFQTGTGQPYSPQPQPSSPPSVQSGNDPRQESIEKQAYFKAAIDLYTLWKSYGADKTLEVFAGEVVKLASLVKGQMNGKPAPSSDDVVIKDIPGNTDLMADLDAVFGPGSTPVLNEGPNAL